MSTIITAGQAHEVLRELLGGDGAHAPKRLDDAATGPQLWTLNKAGLLKIVESGQVIVAAPPDQAP